MKKFFLIAAIALIASCQNDNDEPDVLPYNHVINFENARIADYLAGPTSYGDNLYSSYGNSAYVGYDDSETGLFMMINDPYDTGSYDFWSGGIAISRWNDVATADYTNQCSVFYTDQNTGHGGCNGSQTFALAYGYNDAIMGDTRATISFMDNTTECIFDHFYVCNSAYTALVMRDGATFARKFALGDWLKLTIEAFDKSGSPTGTPVEVFLADFRSATSPGILSQWEKVDLTPLGSHVNTVKFDLQSTDNGAWGMNTPAYFCFDNLAIFK